MLHPATPTAITLGSAAWIAILAIIAGVQYFRGAYIDAAIFSVVIVLLLVDATGRIPSPRPVARPAAAPLLLGAAALAALLILAPRHGILAGTVLALVGIGLLVLEWPDPPPSERTAWTPATARTATVWACVAVAACLAELAQYLLGTFGAGGRAEHPALSDVLDPLVDTSAGKIAFVVVWLAVGALLITAPGKTLYRVMARRAPRIAIVVFWWWLGWHVLVAQTVDP